MELQTATKKVVTNSIIQVIGKTITTLLGLVLTAIIVRSLGVYGYGEFTTAFGFMTFFAVLADFGFYQILVRELARKPEKEAEVVGNVMALRTIFAILIYLIAGSLVWLFPYSMGVKLGVVILTGSYFLMSINSTMVGVFQVHHRMERAVLGDVVGRIILLLLVIFGLQGSMSLPQLLSLYLVGNLANFLISYLFLRKMVSFGLRYEPKAWREVFMETWPMGVVTMLAVLYFKIDIILLSILKTPTEVGIYGAPYKILELLTLFPVIFTGNFLPALTRLAAAHKDDLKRLIQVSFDILSMLAFGIVTGVFLLSEGAINLIAGSEYLTTSTFQIGGVAITATQVLVLLAVALFLIFYTNLWNTVLIAIGHQRSLIVPNLQALVLNLLANLIFIPIGSYFAAAITTILTELFILYTLRQLTRKFVGVEISYRRFGQAALAALVMAALVWPVREAMILIPVALGVIVYYLSLVAMKALPVKPWQLLKTPSL